MFRKIVTHITIVCFTLTLLSGCGTREELQQEKIARDEVMIKEIVTVDGKVYKFRYTSYHTYGVLQDSTIVGELEDGQPVRIALSSVQRVYVIRGGTAKGILTGLGVAASVAAVCSRYRCCNKAGLD